MSRALQLDFADRRRGLTVIGTLLLAAGMLAFVGVLLEYRALAAHRAGLQLRLAAFARAVPAAPSPAAASRRRVRSTGSIYVFLTATTSAAPGTVRT